MSRQRSLRVEPPYLLCEHYEDGEVRVVHRWPLEHVADICVREYDGEPTLEVTLTRLEIVKHGRQRVETRHEVVTNTKGVSNG